jgi:hypothetical protein
MLTILEKANHTVEIIRESPFHGLMRFRYNGEIGNWFDIYSDAVDKVKYFRYKSWKEVEDKENEEV